MGIEWIRKLFGADKRTLEKLRERWGEPGELKRDIKMVSALDSRLEAERAAQARGDKRTRVDQQTWDDLDMPKLFETLDHSLTEPGAQLLLHWLRTPNAARSQALEPIITEFRDNSECREQTQLALHSMKSAGYGIPAVLWDELPRLPLPVRAFRLLRIAMPISAILGVLVHPVLLILACCLFLLNVVTHFVVDKKIRIYVGGLAALAQLLTSSERLLALKSPMLKASVASIRSGREGSKSISRKVATLVLRDPFGVSEYLKSVTLSDVIAYGSVLSRIEKNCERLRELYLEVARLDLALSIASFREYLGDTCVPTYLGDDSRKIVAEELYHPILEEAVANDFVLDDSNLLVMGSNMSGKSTFLKSVGVNVILAQALNTAAAEVFEIPRLTVISAIDILDNISAGKSYYLAEVEAVRRLVDAAAEAGPFVFIIDEVFRGTNPSERVAAATAVLHYLGGRHMVMAATHDAGITSAVTDTYSCVHFKETMTENGLEFDYELRKGPSTSRSAIALLEHTGYPKDIIYEARARLADPSALQNHNSAAANTGSVVPRSDPA